jgi:RNA polymerase sigma-70 factor, ECF subfamily
VKEQIDSPEFHNKLKKRNKEAFKILYGRFKIPLYSLIFSMIKDNDKTADIIQDTFIRVIKKIDQLQDIKKLKQWIFRIAVNLTINRLNKDKRFSMAGDNLDTFTDKEAMKDFRVHGEEELEEVRHMILELVERLPLKHQVVFNLKYVEGFKELEIAEVVDIPVGTVKSRLNIARNRLKQWLKEEMESSQ